MADDIWDAFFRIISIIWRSKSLLLQNSIAPPGGQKCHGFAIVILNFEFGKYVSTNGLEYDLLKYHTLCQVFSKNVRLSVICLCKYVLKTSNQPDLLLRAIFLHYLFQLC